MSTAAGSRSLDVPGGFTDRYRELVDARAQRIPLQHLTGVAPFGPLMLHVGPGVFIPRPETESLLEWATAAVEKQRDPFIVDLCTGTGALAVALARHRPDATVIAVDDSPRRCATPPATRPVRPSSSSRPT